MVLTLYLGPVHTANIYIGWSINLENISTNPGIYKLLSQLWHTNKYILYKTQLLN